MVLRNSSIFLTKCDLALVEFVGGGIEKGKDIVIYKRDDFGFDEYIGVQVKKKNRDP
jgi:hypothetical protein